ncbi:ScbA/BarX family gamma-butyrolactone biosynthesis protein [Streptomyces sp. TG1A-8]|uniref:ScbA/BarX family gamma-butyrolactone biosynthesis protein n=1 Tax=Streptomyces sp. TG1A-8 TaxID=3051385 RepID=UPI00265C11A3|nr:ScbA/BarX family gamma-butyrolactone biosynthesis protein [Streptomyces sp. TG1A-8]MDO0929046.1 ScbA/BarX family gamma-butyrolactone biosynthesis protein [Streptomyces sp. TG1A-8]
MSARIRGAAGAPRALSWSRTVPRELVHRVSVAEVLLTDVLRIDEVHFLAAACWPRSHPTFPADGTAMHHPLMVAETLRQLGIFIPLRYFGVSADARLLITDLFLAAEPGAQPRVRHGATEVTCRVRITRLRTDQAGAAVGLRLHVEFSAGGVAFARAGGGARFLSPGRYAALRGPLAGARRPGAPGGLFRPDPVTLGVNHPRDVVIGLAGTQERAGPDGRDGGHGRDGRGAQDGCERRDVVVDVADPRHPFFFDHATDHVPGMVLLEAARQAAALASGGVLLRMTGARLTALRFTEFTPAARVICVPHHRTCVFRFDQDGERRAFGVLRYHSLSRV